jgi:hypothetical protein
LGFSQIKIENDLVALQSIALKTSTSTIKIIKSQKNITKGIERIKLEIILLRVKALYNEKLDESMSTEKLG